MGLRMTDEIIHLKSYIALNAAKYWGGRCRGGDRRPSCPQRVVASHAEARPVFC